MSLPKITVITPSFNQGHFIRRTIESVLNQDYPNLEYIVIDGGSNDETLSILKSYETRLQWISEEDRGQTHAINKGLERATGTILAYLNSDDIYYPQTLLTVGAHFTKHTDTHWLTGNYEIIDSNDNPITTHGIVKNYKRFMLRFYSYFLLKITNSLIPQPSTFWSREATERVGGFNESLRYCMDYDYWLRLGAHYPLVILNDCLSGFRVHEQSKSTLDYTDQFIEELEVLQINNGSSLELLLHKMHTWAALRLYRNLK